MGYFGMEVEKEVLAEDFNGIQKHIFVLIFKIYFYNDHDCRLILGMSRCNCSEQVESEIEESEVYIRLFPVGHKKLFFSRIIQGSLSSISFTKPTLILLHHDEAGYLWRSFK